jgi:hypothetical protein
MKEELESDYPMDKELEWAKRYLQEKATFTGEELRTVGSRLNRLRDSDVLVFLDYGLRRLTLIRNEMNKRFDEVRRIRDWELERRFREREDGKGNE